ncbi:hypothetical protein P262_04222 [Cronobacter malonaticus]|uniref:Uncharacterized protein n=1 Tax=Cronobacter malonaticus TaxID=413503 RepID=V5U2Y8_9ENTR|nr:hypothetical protein P262_04222 [Cronobacter malonaticus]
MKIRLKIQIKSDIALKKHQKKNYTFYFISYLLPLFRSH